MRLNVVRRGAKLAHACARVRDYCLFALLWRTSDLGCISYLSSRLSAMRDSPPLHIADAMRCRWSPMGLFVVVTKDCGSKIRAVRFLIRDLKIMGGLVVFHAGREGTLDTLAGRERSENENENHPKSA